MSTMRGCQRQRTPQDETLAVDWVLNPLGVATAKEDRYGILVRILRGEATACHNGKKVANLLLLSKLGRTFRSIITRNIY